MINLRIVNTDHAGATLSVLQDLPDMGYSFALSDMGEANWVVPLSHPNLVRDQFAPKLTDYRLGITSDLVNWYTIQGGICGPVGLKTGIQSVAVVGYDYLYYLNQPYPFDYASAYSSLSATDLIKYWVTTNQQTVIAALVAASPLSFTTSFSGTGWTEVMNYMIMYGDTVTLLDHVRAIGEMNQPKGFEFWCDYDRLIRFYAPRRNNASSTPIASFLYVTGSNGLIDIDWTNQGPKATKTVGLSNGLKRGFSEYTPSTAAYREWLELVQLRENLYKQTEIDAATDSIGTLDRFPQKTIKITVKPDEVDPLDETAWFYNHCGKVIHVDSEDYFLPYHRIDTLAIITNQDFKLNNGTWTCDISADYIYA